MSVDIVEETTSDRLIISLACGIGIAVEEMDNIRTQILALANEQGLLIHDGYLEFPAPERPTIEVATVYSQSVRAEWSVRNWTILRNWTTNAAWMRNWTTHAAWAAVALILVVTAVLFSHTTAKAERDWIAPGPPVTRIFKSLDGKFHLATVTRAQPNHPYVEVVMERDITESEVAAELQKLR